MNTKKDLELARSLAEGTAARGGRVYFVGGCVRDRFTGTPVKDVDVEVYGVEPSVLREVLSGLGKVLEKGAAFGVLGLEHSGLDVAMPRRESCTGALHTDFDVSVDPFLSTREASRRRDFTCNAMMEDVLTGEIVDHWHGREDLSAGILRMVSRDTFGEDALRAFRAAQFSARLKAEIEPDTLQVCREMDVTHLSRERIWEETVKALLKADRPSVYFRALREMDHLKEFFPELRALDGVGDAFEKTMRTLDAAACMRSRAEWPTALLFGCLCLYLDRAKANAGEEALACGSEKRPSGGAAERQMCRLTNQTALIDSVINMTELHALPGRLAREGAGRTETREMFDESKCPGDLILLACAEAAGDGETLSAGEMEKFLRERYEDYRDILKQPMVTGRDLTAAGVKPGPRMGAMLKKARHLHFAGVSRAEALARVLDEEREKPAGGEDHPPVNGGGEGK